MSRVGRMIAKIYNFALAEGIDLMMDFEALGDANKLCIGIVARLWRDSSGTATIRVEALTIEEEIPDDDGEWLYVIDPDRISAAIQEHREQERLTKAVQAATDRLLREQQAPLNDTEV